LVFLGSVTYCSDETHLLYDSRVTGDGKAAAPCKAQLIQLERQRSAQMKELI